MNFISFSLKSIQILISDQFLFSSVGAQVVITTL